MTRFPKVLTRRELLLAVAAASLLTAGPARLAHAGDSAPEPNDGNQNSGDSGQEQNDGGHEDHGGHHHRWRRLEVGERRSLRFGEVASDLHIPGSVTIAADTGARTVSAGLADFGGSYGRAEFLLRGRPGAVVFVSYPQHVTATARRGGADLTVRDITSYPRNPIVLDGRGEARVYLGGTLDIAAGQRGDRYAAHLTLSASYQ